MPGIVPAFELDRLRLRGFLAVSAGRIGIPAIRADEPVHHELQHARCLIPMDGGHDHHAMGGDPARIELVHPVVDLAHVMIGVAGTRPVAERHGGGDARFAGVNLAAVFGVDPAQIEEVHGEAAVPFEAFAHLCCHPECFRHLAGAGFIGAWRGGNQKDARLAAVILEALLSLLNGRSRFQPFEREFVLRVGKLRPGLPQVRAFPAVVVSLPRDGCKPLDFRCRSVESRVRKLRPVALLELRARQSGRTLTRADRG